MFIKRNLELMREIRVPSNALWVNECPLHWPVPGNVKGVRGILGKLARPLTQLTKREGFKGNPKAQEAFEELKEKITTPVLALFDFTKEFLIECDASGQGIGAILMQQGKLIALFSKALGK
ncbi:Retrovirus-related Pol polyprotein, partial [Mucuna pruriens]